MTEFSDWEAKIEVEMNDLRADRDRLAAECGDKDKVVAESMKTIHRLTVERDALIAILRRQREQQYEETEWPMLIHHPNQFTITRPPGVQA